MAFSHSGRGLGWRGELHRVAEDRNVDADVSPWQYAVRDVSAEDVASLGKDFAEVLGVPHVYS